MHTAKVSTKLVLGTNSETDAALLSPASALIQGLAIPTYEDIQPIIADPRPLGDSDSLVTLSSYRIKALSSIALKRASIHK